MRRFINPTFTILTKRLCCDNNNTFIWNNTPESNSTYEYYKKDYKSPGNTVTNITTSYIDAKNTENTNKKQSLKQDYFDDEDLINNNYTYHDNYYKYGVNNNTDDIDNMVEVLLIIQDNLTSLDKKISKIEKYQEKIVGILEQLLDSNTIICDKIKNIEEKNNKKLLKNKQKRNKK